jgi:hypothetical protein
MCMRAHVCRGREFRRCKQSIRPLARTLSVAHKGPGCDFGCAMLRALWTGAARASVGLPAHERLVKGACWFLCLPVLGRRIQRERTTSVMAKKGIWGPDCRAVALALFFKTVSATGAMQIANGPTQNRAAVSQSITNRPFLSVRAPRARPVNASVDIKGNA